MYHQWLYMGPGNARQELQGAQEWRSSAFPLNHWLKNYWKRSCPSYWFTAKWPLFS